MKAEVKPKPAEENASESRRKAEAEADPGDQARRTEEDGRSVGKSCDKS